MESPDLLVVGGGPVGLALAIAARQRGLSVAVLERSAPPIDKACGEGVMPDGVACLTALGVTLDPAGRRPFFGIRFIDGDQTAAARFPGPRPDEPVEARGWGVRRLVLHAALAERAAAAGAELRWGEEVVALAGTFDQPAVRTAKGQLVRARFLAAADGLSSRLRSWCGLAGAEVSRRRFGVRRHFAVEPWSDLVEVHFSAEGREGVEAYVTPVGAGQVGVAMLWDAGAHLQQRASFDALLARFPSLAARLAGAAATSRDRGAGPLERRARGVVRGRLALVGDAGGYIDAITGEGLSVGLRQAMALAAAVEAGDLGPYGAAHRRITRLPNALIRATLSLERRAPLRRRVLSCLERDPHLFGRILGIHGGLLPARSIGWRGFLKLATACLGSS